MSKVLVKESSLTNIADAIREKNGTTNVYKPSEMATAISEISVGSAAVINSLEITSNGTYNAPDGVDGYSPIVVTVPQDGSPTEQELKITGDCTYRFMSGWDWFVKKYGNQITTQDITLLTSMFRESKVESIPFELNLASYNTWHTMDSMFYRCTNLKSLPKMNGVKPGSMKEFFQNCESLRYIPDDYFDDWDLSVMVSGTAYNRPQQNMFYGCRSLRKLPKRLIQNLNNASNYSYCMYYYGFNSCYCLDEVSDLGIHSIVGGNSQMTNNGFYACFVNNSRLKKLTFMTQEDGTPYGARWKSQSIQLHNYVGYFSIGDVSYAYSYNSGITKDKQVVDDATYQALKNDPDWFTCDPAYSRYNHDSALETIRSLPDTTSTGTNTIIFKGESGSKTDGGAINTLTEEEIAIATSKGWTVSLQ